MGVFIAKDASKRQGEDERVLSWRPATENSTTASTTTFPFSAFTMFLRKHRILQRELALSNRVRSTGRAEHQEAIEMLCIGYLKHESAGVVEGHGGLATRDRWQLPTTPRDRVLPAKPDRDRVQEPAQCRCNVVLAVAKIFRDSSIEMGWVGFEGGQVVKGGHDNAEPGRSGGAAARPCT
ncbi:hypothetical protein M427DRAFT_36412 [Gonapodya prolifera JEL478]|uniref:Uncharacterized protein n=1 Tax=Gonapodya prolifera (strain JEL478) TaxID=1344416 RepID=A0A139A2C4_GONPJ|nr:hypothetical protein M427DRAFT_36412 [Gonapodya prolifera JEL478]|eukprot:KXS10940.1 hypothetical protein M427DRAFT_36412 [Gonapodya prolifera JEL478]